MFLELLKKVIPHLAMYQLAEPFSSSLLAWHGAASACHSCTIAT